jgi:indole-3-glycerol phosphate synthase
MCSWANFYRRLANEARERAARVSNGSIKDKFEAVAKEWSALAVWAELKRSSPSTATEVDTREANRTWAS